jgi:DNA-directed RNA polymerase subunit RPC12/RpoP
LDKSAIRSSQERKGERIFTNIRPTGIRSVEAGAAPGAGTFFCTDCGAHLSLLEEDLLPECPSCGGSSFGRDSIFESMQDHGGQTAEYAVPHEAGSPEWLDEARAMLAEVGRGLAFRDDDGPIEVFPIAEGWTRIGRSAAADLRLDDPSVSRRHALIVSERPKALRVLDDRSLNGVRLNDARIEWARLVDGDELGIGRYRLFVLEA